MAHRIQLIGLAALFFVGACGLGVVGVDPEPDAAAPVPDGGTPVGEASSSTDANDSGPAPLPADCSVTSCDRIGLTAPGFVTIAFGNGDDVCPNGFDTTDAIMDPDPQNGSCQCGPCTTTGSSCSTGSVRSTHSDDDRCNENGAPFDAAGGGCSPDNGKWATTYGAVAPPAPKLGTCKAEGQGVRGKVNAKAMRVCTPRADTCAAALCSLTGKLEVCLVAPGDVACPAVASEKELIGTDVSMTCDACTCKPVAMCGGSLDWWEVSTSCAGTPSGSLPANTCTKVGGKNTRSFRWNGVVTSESCSNVEPPPKAKVALSDVRTVCCPKK